MPFLSWLGAIIVKVGLDKVIGLVKTLVENFKHKRKINSDVAAVVEAKTPDEQERAHEEIVITNKPHS